MDDTGNVTQDSQQDVDEQVSTAAALQEDTQRGEEDGKEDLADVAGRVSRSSESRQKERTMKCGSNRRLAQAQARARAQNAERGRGDREAN